MSKQLSKRLDVIFSALNTQLEERGEYLEIALIGGMLGLYHLGLDGYRHTEDIDVVVVESTSTGISLREYGIHEVTVVEVPPVEDLEYGATYEYGNLTINVPSIEMFAIYKLMSTRGKDLQDLENTGILKQCDIGKLKLLVEEYKPYLLNENNTDYNFYKLEDLNKG